VISDPFAHDDAAYVLGALSPAQRREFEAHLAGCETCARSVRELAGLPGLMTGLGVDAFADEPDGPDGPVPVPESLLPRLLAEVRRQRRRRVWLTVGAAAAALVVVATLAGVLLVRGTGTVPEATTPPAQQMTQVDQDRLTASVSLEPVAWGTRMHLRCTYAEGWGDPGVSYALVVHTRDAGAQQVATWRAVPGRETRLEAATDADLADIGRVDVVVAGTDRRLLTVPGPAQ
jgi:hypothetical protein